MDTSQSAVEPLYFKRIPVITRSVRGPFRRFKTALLWLGFAVYFILPWIPWSRPDSPSQAVMFDIPGRRYMLFDMTVYPQDVFWLSLLLFIAAMVLFFATVLVGRAFCGYFCFQTLWTDAFMFIESWVQGERPARIRLHKQAWNAEKIGKYTLTHALWLLLSFLTAYAFVMYYGYAPELTQRFFSGSLPFVAYFTVLILTLTTYAAAGLAREQVCTYMCPYARFQGVMYEPETLAPYYDFQRGEGTAGHAVPREGSKTREERQAKGVGDCIDCGFCVQVCPAGIDIRKGLQYQCISCGLCVDACNNIMDSVGFPKGLIRYDSEINIESKNPGKPHLDLLRLRTVGYGAMMLVMVGALVYNVATRSDVQISIQPVRQPLFVVMSDGDIRNRYQIHVTNKTLDVQKYRISAQGIPDGALDLGEMREVSVRQGKSVMVLANVKLNPDMASKISDVEFVITPLSMPAQAVTKKVRFYAKHEG